MAKSYGAWKLDYKTELTKLGEEVGEWGTLTLVHGNKHVGGGCAIEILYTCESHSLTLM